MGLRSEWGKILAELATERDDTPLQDKLTVLAEDIGKAGTLVAALCFAAQLVIWLYDNGRETCFFPSHGNMSGMHAKRALQKSPAKEPMTPKRDLLIYAYLRPRRRLRAGLPRAE